MKRRLTAAACLPADRAQATLIGRIWSPHDGGPIPIAVVGDDVVDFSSLAPTVRDLLERGDPVAEIRAASALPRFASLADVLANSSERERETNAPWLLAPCDLQAIKASGVTFVESMLERVIEEQARGDPAKAQSVRRAIVAVIGDDLASVRPGSPDAARLKDVLIEQHAWSQYLEVGIGPDAEIFTKSQPMSAVGLGADIGIHPKSEWNNPEPEIVLVVDSRGRTLGATMGNDVNLRDFEGRSALLLGKAKDNNASCAIGPFIRLFDDRFGIDTVRRCELAMRVDGPDGFALDGSSSMAKISRDPLDLVAQAPTKDRLAPGQGFTHVVGDVVTVSTPSLGALVNRVDTSDAIAPWAFGAGALMHYLARRGLLGPTVTASDFQGLGV